MLKNPLSIGFSLYLLSMLIYFFVYFFMMDVKYFETSLMTNFFVFSPLYALAGFYSIYQIKKYNPEIGFREGFKSAFTPMFVAGLLTMLSIFIFLNFIDTDAKDLLNHQYVERQKTELNNEYTKAKKILKNKADILELEKKYQERLQSFAPERVEGKDMLTFSHFSAYFAAITVFYLILSIFLTGFLRTKRLL